MSERLSECDGKQGVTVPRLCVHTCAAFCIVIFPVMLAAFLCPTLAVLRPQRRGCEPEAPPWVGLRLDKTVRSGLSGAGGGGGVEGVGGGEGWG